jgi:hypothetical protein
VRSWSAVPKESVTHPCDKNGVYSLPVENLDVCDWLCCSARGRRSQDQYAPVF